MFHAYFHHCVVSGDYAFLGSLILENVIKDLIHGYGLADALRMFLAGSRYLLNIILVWILCVVFFAFLYTLLHYDWHYIVVASGWVVSNISIQLFFCLKNIFVFIHDEYFFSVLFFFRCFNLIVVQTEPVVPKQNDSTLFVTNTFVRNIKFLHQWIQVQYYTCS